MYNTSRIFPIAALKLKEKIILTFNLVYKTDFNSSMASDLSFHYKQNNFKITLS